MNFNYPFSTFVDLLRDRALQQPNQIAYTFLLDGETEKVQLTYQALYQRVLTIAVHLQSVATPGERALLLYPPGLDYITAFLACLCSGVIAVPAYPPRPNRTDPRLQAIIKDAQATLVLTNGSLLTNGQQRFASIPELAAIHCLSTDHLSGEITTDWRNPGISHSHIALLQYTSGSTGKPKGVMVSHDNLLHNLGIIAQSFGLAPDTPSVSWLPLYHDMGLIGNILQPIYSGFSVTLMSPVAFLQKPLRWLQAITRYQATITGAPNFAYDLCVNKINAEQQATLDLSSLQVAFCGAEPIRAATLARFTASFADCGFRPGTFYPCYGMAEATVFITGKTKKAPLKIQYLISSALEQNQIVTSIEQAGAQSVVSCGEIGAGDKLAIVDPHSFTRCSTDQIGEIWLSGPSVAQGYWQQPVATAQAFQAYLADTGEGPFLRTGDLGFLQENELFVTGRLKDLFILRGRNYYPQDIEHTVEQCHPALQPSSGAAFGIEIDGDEQLVIVQEVQRSYLRTLSVDEIMEAICAAVAEAHELQVYAVALLRPGSIPKTSSGKIQRHRCRANFLGDNLDVIGQWTAKRLRPTKLPISIDALSPDPDHSQSARSHNGKLEGSMTNTARGALELSKKRADDLIGWLREYANTRINSRLIDERRTVPPYIMLDFGNRGLFGLQVLEKYGGLNLGHSDVARVIQQLAAIDLTLAASVGLNNTLGLRPIMGYANEALRDELLPILATGRELASFAMTEPGAGADLGAISALAVADPQGGWRLRGVKRWNGSAWAGVINVFVRLHDPATKLNGLTGFVVRQGTPGLRMGPESLTMGLRGIMQNALYLEDVPVDARHLLGELGKGIEPADDALLFARLGTGIVGLGGMQRCAQLMLRYASRRTVATGHLLDNPVTLARISDLTVSITVMESIITLLTQHLDAGHAMPREVAMLTKITGSEFLWRAADDLVQMLGGRGYMETNLAPQLLRDARVLRIGEGPNESLNIFVGRSVIHTETLQDFLRNTLNASTLANQLSATAQQIHDRWTGAHGRFADRSSALTWVYALTGEVALYTFLLAAVEHRSSREPTIPVQRAIAWARQRLEQAQAKAQHDAATEAPLLNAQETNTLITSYQATIGDLEQTAAGEDTMLDPLLRREFITPGQKVDLPGSVAFQSPPSPLFDHMPPQTAASIQAWLVAWVANDLERAVETIDPTKSFLHYGFDSLKAATLLYDLEKWLGRALSPMIVWEYPTLAALTQFLADGDAFPLTLEEQNTFHQTQAALPSQQKSTEQLLAGLDQLSEQEVDALLNTLLAEEENGQ